MYVFNEPRSIVSRSIIYFVTTTIQVIYVFFFNTYIRLTSVILLYFSFFIVHIDKCVMKYCIEYYRFTINFCIIRVQIFIRLCCAYIYYCNNRSRCVCPIAYFYMLQKYFRITDRYECTQFLWSIINLFLCVHL